MLIFFDNWSVTLRSFYVQFDVYTMGRYNESPRKGHLGDMLRIFGYLNHYMRGYIICGTIFLD